MAVKETYPEEAINEILAKCYADPLAYVMAAFPWEWDKTIQVVELPEKYCARFPGATWGPDLWACEFLDELGQQIRDRAFNGVEPVMPIMFSTASGHGIGKSVMVAWLVKFITDTRPMCRGTVTATTADQLRTKTWAEVGKWHNLSLTRHRFRYSTGRGAMSLTHKEFGANWGCQGQTCREENSEAFAGQHAAASTSFYIFDEASGIPSKIFQVRTGGLTDGEPMVFDFGNPTRNSGEFFENCEGKSAHNYIVRHIDSRDVAITNKAYFNRLVKDHGEDSDYIRSRVRGQFPRLGTSQFIAVNDVLAAMERELTHDPQARLVIGVDVGGRGGDETVIKPRLGMDARSWPAVRVRGLDTVQIASRVIALVNQFRTLKVPVGAIFVDANGIGAGVFDQLSHMGYPVFGVQFAGHASDPLMYWRKGHELWGNMRDAIQSNLCLPRDNETEGLDFKTQLTNREYWFMSPGGQIVLESKEDMKERDVQSPDMADALALTFAQELAPLNLAGEPGHVSRDNMSWDYDPMENG